MHLKRKDSIKLKNIRKWMEGKTPVLHELSIRQDYQLVTVRGLFDSKESYADKTVGFVAKKELKGTPITLIMEEIHCLFLDREDPRQGLKTILTAIDYVKDGISMFIFPEGTRCKVEGTFLPFHAGSFKIATKAKVPVIPVTLVGMGDIFEDHFPRIKRVPVVIEFGDPIETADMDRNAQKELPDRVKAIIEETYKRDKALIAGK